jgi:hypothetical protein
MKKGLDLIIILINIILVVAIIFVSLDGYLNIINSYVTEILLFLTFGLFILNIISLVFILSKRKKESYSMIITFCILSAIFPFTYFIALKFTTNLFLYIIVYFIQILSILYYFWKK